jgi:membrane-associated HD superfamily phosphohydrolase
MNKYQAVTLIVAAINLLLMLLFPPYDYLSTTHHNVPNFDGFLFVFGDHSNRAVNQDLLTIEIFTVLVNTAIAWLLLRERARLRRRTDRQNLVLLGVALNLLLALLFPPFQDHYTASKALLPSFDGFYFVFKDNSMRVIITSMLWLEVIFILVNGAMLWLLLHRPAPQEMSAAERFAQAEELLGTRTRRKP